MQVSDSIAKWLQNATVGELQNLMVATGKELAKRERSDYRISEISACESVARELWKIKEFASLSLRTPYKSNNGDIFDMLCIAENSCNGERRVIYQACRFGGKILSCHEHEWNAVDKDGKPLFVKIGR